MEDFITIKKGPYSVKLKKLSRKDGKESYTYLLKSAVNYIKTGYTDCDKRFIKLSSGICFTEGDNINGLIIRHIDFTNMGYLISF